MLCVPLLFQGTVKECFAFDIKRDSVVPQLLGYPPLKSNQIEGVVIKQLEYGGVDRKIFKYKNAKFEEVNPKVPQTKYEKIRDAKAASIDKFYTEFGRYVNENRLNNLRSKFGEIGMDKLNEAGKMLADDAFEDFLGDNKELWDELGQYVGVRDKCKGNTEGICRGFIQTWIMEQKQAK